MLVNSNGIQLGDEVEEIISGSKGIVIAITKFLYDHDSVAFRPQENKNEKPLPFNYMDITTLKLLQKQVIDRANVDFPLMSTMKRSKSEVKIEHGDEAIDLISEFKGIVTGLNFWYTGSVRVGITPRGLNFIGKPSEEEWFELGRIVILTKNKIKKESKFS